MSFSHAVIAQTTTHKSRPRPAAKSGEEKNIAHKKLERDPVIPEIMKDISSDIRNQYSLAYHPTNPKLDGSYRKLKVELVAADGSGPLKVKDQKGKDVKFQIWAREGYTAKHQVE